MTKLRFEPESSILNLASLTITLTDFQQYHDRDI